MYSKQRALLSAEHEVLELKIRFVIVIFAFERAGRLPRYEAAYLSPDFWVLEELEGELNVELELGW